MDKQKQLRLVALEIVYQSTLTKASKLQLLNYIKEASIPQIKVLLMDGEIVELDEQAETLVNDRFEVSEAGGRVAKLRKSLMTQYGSSGGVNPVWIVYRKIRSHYDQCTKRCGTYELNTSRRQHCMIKCKVQKLQGMLAAAKKSGSKEEVKKLEAKLVTAKAELSKSVQSFKSRGAVE